MLIIFVLYYNLFIFMRVLKYLQSNEKKFWKFYPIDLFILSILKQNAWNTILIGNI